MKYAVSCRYFVNAPCQSSRGTESVSQVQAFKDLFHRFNTQGQGGHGNKESSGNRAVEDGRVWNKLGRTWYT